MNLVGEKSVFPLNQLASRLCLFPGDFAKGFLHGTGSLWPSAVVVAAAGGHPAPCRRGQVPAAPHPSACHPHGQSQRATAVGQQQGVPQQRGWDSSPWPRFDTCSLAGYLNPCKRQLTSSPIHQM